MPAFRKHKKPSGQMSVVVFRPHAFASESDKEGRKEGKCGVGETASSHFFCFLHWGAAERLRKGALWTGCGVIWVCTRQGPPEDWGSFVCCDAFLHDLVDDVRNNLVSSELLTTLDGLWNWPCCARLMHVHHFWCFLAKGLKCWPIVIKQ